MSGPKIKIIENDEREHAEKKLVNYLKKMRLPPKKVTVYINNSPCAACAEILKTYLEKNEGIHLTLYVTHLYNIKRKSCQDRAITKNEGHINFIDDDKHEANYLGLRDLMNLGDNRCKIEAFTEDVWRELHKVMGLTENFQQRMTTYDTKNRMKKHDRSRKSEDSNIRHDLIHLQANADPWLGIPRKK